MVFHIELNGDCIADGRICGLRVLADGLCKHVGNILDPGDPNRHLSELSCAGHLLEIPAKMLSHLYDAPLAF